MRQTTAVIHAIHSGIGFFIYINFHLKGDCHCGGGGGTLLRIFQSADGIIVSLTRRWECLPFLRAECHRSE